MRKCICWSLSIIITKYLLFNIQIRAGHVTLDKYSYFHIIFLTGNNARYTILKLRHPTVIHHAYTYCDVNDRRHDICGEERVLLLELLISVLFYTRNFPKSQSSCVCTKLTELSRGLRSPANIASHFVFCLANRGFTVAEFRPKQNYLYASSIPRIEACLNNTMFIYE